MTDSLPPGPDAAPQSELDAPPARPVMADPPAGRDAGGPRRVGAAGGRFTVGRGRRRGTGRRAERFRRRAERFRRGADR